MILFEIKNKDIAISKHTQKKNPFKTLILKGLTIVVPPGLEPGTT